MPTAIENGSMQTIESDMPLLFHESSEDHLVTEITQKVKKFYSWKWIASACCFFGFYTHPAFFFVGLVLGPLAFLWDETRKSVVLFYDFDDVAQRKFENAVDGYVEAMKAKRIWHIEASGEIKDWKRHSGAHRSFKRKRTHFSLKPPHFLKINIPIPTLYVGQQTLCFLPNKLLVLSPRSAATVRYSDLNIEVALSQFIESESVPSDAEVVDHTWQFVNKKGGPDRRFKNNKQFPVCAYEAVGFTSDSGLNQLIQISKRGQFEKFKDSVAELARQAA